MSYNDGKQPKKSFADIIDNASNDHLSRLTCSMVPTFDYWRSLSNKVLTDIMKSTCNICFEYPVESIPRGKNSFTDVMLISDDTVVAVESKWTESTSVYCKDHTSTRRIELMNHWLDMIKPFTETNLSVIDLDDIEYQLLHRTASACSLNKANTNVVYQLFYEGNLNLAFHYEILKLKNLLSPTTINFYINTVEITPNSFHNALSSRILNLSLEDKAKEIKKALKQYPLFTFKKETINKI